MNVLVVTCPKELVEYQGLNCVFVAGGISNCPDWQSYFVDRVCKTYKGDTKLVLVNPRRNYFDTSDDSMSEAQIHWEFRHIRRCNTMIFWFPKETLCPITLFELGAALERDQNVLIGCHPEYGRKIDLVYQVGLRKPGTHIHFSLEELVSSLLK